MNLSYRLSHPTIEAGADAEALLLITISAPSGHVERRPVNLGVALDRSDSMSGEPLAIAKTALGQFVDQLLPEDRLTVVAFDNVAHPVVSAQTATDKTAIRASIAGIGTGGSTNLSAGWLAAADLVAAHADAGTFSRVVLLSDGHANAGIVEHDKIADIALGLAKRGLATTTIGIGAHYDDVLLSIVAARSGGNVHHLDSVDGVDEILAGEFEELVSLYAQNVVLEIAPGSTIIDTAVLSGYPVSYRKTGGLSIACGDIVAGDNRYVLIRFRCGEQANGSHPLTGITLKYHQVAGEIAFHEAQAFVSIDRADVVESTPIDTIVSQHLTIANGVIARRTAADLAEAGDIERASSLLALAAEEMRDAGLEDDAVELERSRASLIVDAGMTSKGMRTRASSRSRSKWRP